MVFVIYTVIPILKWVNKVKLGKKGVKKLGVLTFQLIELPFSINSTYG